MNTPHDPDQPASHLRQQIQTLEAQIQQLQQTIQRQQQFVYLLEQTSDYVAIADPQGRFLYMNAAGRAMVGIDPDADITQFAIPDIVTESMLQGELARSIEITLQRGMFQGETRLRHRQTQTEIPGSLVLLCNRTAAGQPATFSAIIRDISAQKQAEAMMQVQLEQAAVIRHQAAALQEMSTPLIPISRAAVIMPLIGAIDSQRATQIMATLLQGIAAQHARLAIIDITGVPIVDTQVAHVLIQAARAARLLGTQVLLTGLSPALAQTIVALELDLSDLVTLGSLEAGIMTALGMEAGLGA